MIAVFWALSTVAIEWESEGAGLTGAEDILEKVRRARAVLDKMQTA